MLLKLLKVCLTFIMLHKRLRKRYYKNNFLSLLEKRNA